MKLQFRLLSKLKANGIIDGLWTVSSSIGSKLQTLVLLSIAGRQFGLIGVGLVIVSMSTAILVSSVVDMGLSSQIIRSFSAGTLRHKNTVLRPIRRRIIFVSLGSAIAAYFFVAPQGLSHDKLGWVITVAIYAAGFQSSLLISQTAYGNLRFRQGAALTGGVRILTVPILFLTSFCEFPVYCLIVVLGVGELTIAVIQYRLIPLSYPDRSSADDPEVLNVRATWRYGIGSIANTVMNKSDTVVIALVASSTVLGTYGLASQIENSLTTAALIPAGAIIAYTARLTSHKDRRLLGVSVSTAVACVYIIVAIPFLTFPTQVILFIFGTHIENSIPFIICVIAGIFSCLGGVAMQQLVGMGEQRIVMTTWIVVAVLAVAALMMGAFFFGAIGAAVGALFRDIVFFGITSVSLRRQLKVRTGIEISI